jgi:hypothetical protein
LSPADPPEIRIERGSPTPEEEAAIRAAILKLWRDDRAAAARIQGSSPWVVAARAEAIRAGIQAARGEHAWRLSAFLDEVPSWRTGRGDSR